MSGRRDVDRTSDTTLIKTRSMAISRAFHIRRRSLVPNINTSTPISRQEILAMITWPVAQSTWFRENEQHEARPVQHWLCSAKMRTVASLITSKIRVSWKARVWRYSLSGMTAVAVIPAGWRMSHKMKPTVRPQPVIGQMFPLKLYSHTCNFTVLPQDRHIRQVTVLLHCVIWELVTFYQSLFYDFWNLQFTYTNTVLRKSTKIDKWQCIRFEYSNLIDLSKFAIKSENYIGRLQNLEIIECRQHKNYSHFFRLLYT